MKKVRILALHLDYGGVEKAIISTANMLAERYDVEIISVYDMPNGPAFPLDPRVKVRYLLDDIPNREEWKAAVREKKTGAIVKESVRALRILRGKKKTVIETIRSIHDGVLITTRHEDNVQLSRYGDPKVLKIAQLHHDHRFEKKYLEGFRKDYGKIDIFMLLAPRLVDEVREVMGSAAHTKLVYVPNFLEHYPENVSWERREKAVVAVGRLEQVKGFDRLIRCFAAVHEKAPDWQLRIIGEGGQRQELENLIESLHASDGITLTGRMDSHEVEQEMLRASFYAMSSYSEGFPFVLIEAQSCGLPTVAFDVRVGPGTILNDGEDGFLVPDGDEARYQEKLLALIREPALRERMGREAVKHAKEFSRETVGKTWFSLIEGSFDGEE